MPESSRHHIVIVGGGAGGLELATKLGDSLGKRKLADITLVDAKLKHIWKPLLHEVAAGSLNSHEDDLDYLAQARWHHFRFRLGRMDQVDRVNKVISLAPTVDEQGDPWIPRRQFKYDTLVIAVGSVTNDFGIPGVADFCLSLDSLEEAEKFHQLLLKRCYSAHTQTSPIREGQLHVAIAGAGATGVELAAELHNTTRELVAYGLDQIQPDKDIRFTLVEAADRILPALPVRLSSATAKALESLGIEIRSGERIVKATEKGFETDKNHFIASDIKVWAAGIKAPDFLKNIDGLETNRANQLLVNEFLHTHQDENIFAFGDCAACPLNEHDIVPPRAQAAHQQASLLVKSLKRRLAGKPLLKYRYVDYGSLVNLSRYSTVGNLMGNLLGRWTGNIMLEGILARFVYLSLYKMHLLALHGAWKVGLMTLSNMLIGRGKSRMKLH